MWALVEASPSAEMRRKHNSSAEFQECSTKRGRRVESAVPQIVLIGVDVFQGARAVPTPKKASTLWPAAKLAVKKEAASKTGTVVSSRIPFCYRDVYGYYFGYIHLLGAIADQVPR